MPVIIIIITMLAEVALYNATISGVVFYAFHVHTLSLHEHVIHSLRVTS